MRAGSAGTGPLERFASASAQYDGVILASEVVKDGIGWVCITYIARGNPAASAGVW